MVANIDVKGNVLSEAVRVWLPVVPGGLVKAEWDAKGEALLMYRINAKH